MKKNLLMLLTLALMAWAILPGCATDSEKKPALQAPDTTTTLAPVPKADSTAGAEKKAGGEKAEKEEDEKDDDDDRK